MDNKYNEQEEPSEIVNIMKQVHILCLQNTILIIIFF